MTVNLLEDECPDCGQPMEEWAEVCDDCADPEADLPNGYDPDENRQPDSFDPPDRDEHGSY